MPVRAVSPVLVGRDEEVAALRAFGRLVRDASEPRVALVAGRAGMGKTRVTMEAAEQLRREGLRVLVGCCPPLGADGPPYAAISMALARTLPLASPVLAALTGQAELDRGRLLHVLATTVTQLAGAEPTVLVVEDLHWADRATREALLYLVATGRGRWGLIVTYRYEGPLSRGELAAFTGLLERRPLVRLSLDTLSVDDVGHQISAITGSPASADVASEVHRRSGGIPLLVEEVVAAGDHGVPQHLRVLFNARVASLGSDVGAALQVVAVADRCDEAVIATVLGRDAESVVAAVTAAVDADLLVADSDGYSLRHELLREAVYEELSPGRRRELHSLVAAALGDESAATLAHHLYRAGRWEEAARASIDAADDASRAHAPASTHLHLERVVELWPRLGDDLRTAIGGHDDVLRRAAVAAERAGAFSRASVLAEERAQLWPRADQEQAGRLERLARYRWESGDGPGAETAYEQAMHASSTASSASRCRVLSSYAWYLGASYELDRAKALSDEALVFVGKTTDATTRWQAALSWGIARLGEEAGRRALRDALEIATGSSAAYQVVVSRLWLNNALQLQGATGDRTENLKAAMRFVADEGLGHGAEAAASFMQAEFSIETGAWDEAAQTLERVRPHAAGMSSYFSWGLGARLAAMRGDADALGEAWREISAMSEAAPQQPVPHAMALLACAEEALWAGRAAEGLAKAREALVRVQKDEFYRAEATALVARAEADQADDMRRAGRVVATPVDDAGSIDSLHPQLRAQAVTTAAERTRRDGRRDPGPWQEAVAAWTATSDVYRLACARWRLAWALLGSRTGRAEATSQLNLAWTAASALRAVPLVHAIEALATKGRIPLGGVPATAGELSLTGRELEVLPLMAAGRTNGEIAEILVISPRTVGVHVSQILRKLGATRRTEAADQARRLGLLDD